MSPLARVVAGLLLAAGVANACGDGGAPAEAAVVRFAFEGHPDTMRVEVRGAVIGQVREYLAGRSQARMPLGPIVRGAGVDARYPFHYLPDSVRLVEVATEVCDAAPMHTEEEVDRFIAGATGDPDAESAIWCPWTARPIAIE